MPGMLDSGARVAVIGGANTDIVGVSACSLLSRDSNPGQIRVSAGGVGRNIAENLARLGVGVTLVTAFGGDEPSAALRRSCDVVGIDTTHSVVVGDLPGAHYLAILDENRDMAVAVNDMRVLDAITPEVLAEPARAAALAGASMIVVDSNLPAASIEWIASRAVAPVVFEPVSVAKTPRASAALDRMWAVTPNAAEAAQALGHAVEGMGGAEAAARELVSRGVRHAFVTCGALGTAWADGAASGVVPAPRVQIANASGAGDAFCAGVVWALLRGESSHGAAIAGSVLAALALQDAETVSPSVSAATVLAYIEELRQE